MHPKVYIKKQQYILPASHYKRLRLAYIYQEEVKKKQRERDILEMEKEIEELEQYHERLKMKNEEQLSTLESRWEKHILQYHKNKLNTLK